MSNLPLLSDKERWKHHSRGCLTPFPYTIVSSILSEVPKKVRLESIGQILFRNSEGVRKREGLESFLICVVK